MTKWIATFGLSLALIGCGGSSGATSASADKAGSATKTQGSTAAGGKTDAASGAKVGEMAPDFTLKDLDGKEVTLSSFKGKTVVLEWFNPECPFVKNSHSKGGLVDTAKKLGDKGVVWLAVNSGAAGKQGAGVDKNKEGRDKWSLTHPILMDEDGKVGKLYGATNTPHMYVVDKAGKLVYAGAIDNSPDGESQSPEGGTLVNYVTQAVDELDAGKAISVASTKAYGCGVKY